MPPFLFEISNDSRTTTSEVYAEVIMTAFSAMKRAPRIGITRLSARVHSFWKTEKDLPASSCRVIRSWKETVTGDILLTGSKSNRVTSCNQTRRSAG